MVLLAREYRNDPTFLKKGSAVGFVSGTEIISTRTYEEAVLRMLDYNPSFSSKMAIPTLFSSHEKSYKISEFDKLEVLR